MYSFDASSKIHAWDNYPIENEHFESLWAWFAEKIEDREFTISEIALKEVASKIPECGKWLNDHHIKIHKLSPATLHQTQSIKTILEISEEEYSNGGVGENDLFIIAIAKDSKLILVTEEARQNNLPTKKHNYKIPAVCGLPEVNVTCIYFVDLIKKKPTN